MRNLIPILMLAIPMLAGCSEKSSATPLHEDETRLAALTAGVAIAVVLRGPLYLVAIASIITSVGFLLRENASRPKITRTMAEKG